MNLYLRYFDREVFVHSVDEALQFLRSIPEITITPEMERDLREYAASKVFFPKRYKVRAHVYFIVIKTVAATMEDFKEKKGVRAHQPRQKERFGGDLSMGHLMEERPGWYEGELNFKRVVLVPGTGKHEYRDTRFVARCKANSGQDCYNRIVDHLQGMVDDRSQFPSAKGRNFQFHYLGMWK